MIEEVVNILFYGENISFEANLVMYINSTSIPPIIIIIINRIMKIKSFCILFLWLSTLWLFVLVVLVLWP